MIWGVSQGVIVFPWVVSRSRTPTKLQYEPRVDILQHSYEYAPLNTTCWPDWLPRKYGVYPKRRSRAEAKKTAEDQQFMDEQEAEFEAEDYLLRGMTQARPVALWIWLPRNPRLRGTMIAESACPALLHA